MTTIQILEFAIVLLCAYGIAMTIGLVHEVVTHRRVHRFSEQRKPARRSPSSTDPKRSPRRAVDEVTSAVSVNPADTALQNPGRPS